MKNTIKSTLIIAAAAMAFAACTAEPVETPQEPNGTHKVTFVASIDETKTTMSVDDGIASFAWEEADENYFQIYENGVLATDVIGDIDGNGLMQIIAEFEGSEAPYTYTGFFAPTFSTYPQVPSSQEDNGKYDPKADILVAKPITPGTSQSGEVLSFQFKRIVAINKMTIKGLTAGETISNVTIVSDKPIAGNYDFVNEVWNNSTDMQITVTANSVANSAGEADIYFVCAPVNNAQLTVTATTAEGKSYSKEFASPITFSEGAVKFFGVTVEDSEGSDLVEITLTENFLATNATTNKYDCQSNISTESNRDDFDYLWTCEGSGTVFKNGIKLGNGSGTGSVSSSAILTDLPAGTEFTVKVYAAVWNTDGGNLLVSYDGEPVEKKPSNDPITTTTTEYSSDSFTSSTDFVFTKSSDSSKTLKVASSKKRILIDKIEIVYVGTPAEIVSVNGLTLNQPTLSLEVGENKTLVATVTPENATNKSVTWSSSDESVATVADGVVTAKAVGTATITATSADDENISATCAVTVSAPTAKEYSSLAELLEDGEPTDAGRPVTVTITNEVIESIYVTSQGYRNGVFLNVPGKTIEIYCYNVPEDWVAFGKLSGTLTNCIWKKYNSTWELCPEDWTKLNYVAPVKYNIAVPTGLTGGSVSADKNEAAEGEEVKITVKPAEGYELASLSYNGHDIKSAKSFTMPAADVTVAAAFSPKEDGGNVDGDNKVLTFALTSNPGGWPTSNSTTLTDYIYTLDETDYTFALKNVKCNSGYLMLTQPAALGLPAVDGYKLSKVVAKNSGGCSPSVNVGVSSSAASASYVTGGDAQTWETQSSQYTYELTDTAANTVYYLYVTSKNAQIVELSLTYTPAN